MMKLPSDFLAEERGARAEKLFLEGYNCCQSVLLAFADLLEQEGLDKRQIASLSSGFGGGMARLREVCGCFSALTFVSGFISPAIRPKMMEERTANYALVQDFAARFKEANGGSIICRELLGIAAARQENPRPSERTEEYYKKRPCGKTIRNTAIILANYLIENQSI